MKNSKNCPYYRKCKIYTYPLPFSYPSYNPYTPCTPVCIYDFHPPPFSHPYPVPPFPAPPLYPFLLLVCVFVYCFFIHWIYYK